MRLLRKDSRLPYLRAHRAPRGAFALPVPCLALCDIRNPPQCFRLALHSLAAASMRLNAISHETVEQGRKPPVCCSHWRLPIRNASTQKEAEYRGVASDRWPRRVRYLLRAIIMADVVVARINVVYTA